MMFRIGFLGLGALTAWIVFAWANSNHLFDGSALPGYLKLAAVALTGLLVALLLVGLILDLGLRRGLRVEPVGAQRVVIFIIVTFGVTALAMKLMGYDITTILTTSALLTAIVGFALQPTLGGLFSGIALQLDSHLKPGDGIRYKGDNVKIESMNWRSVVGRLRDDTLIIIPNSSLAGEPVEIFPHDRPIWQISYFHVPATLPPQRVSDLVRDAVADLDFVNATLPVMVLPYAHKPDQAAIEYRVRFQVAYYFETPELDAEFKRRLWYVFQRENIPFPVSRLYGEDLRSLPADTRNWPDGADFKTAARAALLAAGIEWADHEAIAELAQVLEAHSTVLMYGPLERITLPARLGERPVLLAAGAVHQSERSFAERRQTGDLPRPEAMRHYVYQLSNDAQIQRIAVLLADHIGPYAEQAVAEAAAQASGVRAIVQRVAAEINDPAARETFSRDALFWTRDGTGPGLWAETHRNASGKQVTIEPWRALDEAVFLALAPEAVSAFHALRDRLADARTK